MHKDCVCKSQN